MANTLNVYDIKDYKSIAEEKHLKEIQKNLLRETQRNLKSIENSELPSKMLTATTKAMAENKQVVTEVCNMVNGWIAFENKKKDSKKMFVNETKFINEIRKNDDFIDAYIVEEDICTIILIIKDAIFANNKKYLKYAREFKELNSCEFNLSIFDLEDLDEVEEQLKYMKVYGR